MKTQIEDTERILKNKQNKTKEQKGKDKKSPQISSNSLR